MDKTHFLELSDCRFVRQGRSIIITGATGTGKSFLACALGHQACMLGFSTTYSNMQKLLLELKLAKVDGSILKWHKQLAKTRLLILDDFGLAPLDQSQRLDLLEIIEDRHGRKSTVIASQLPIDKWYDIIGDNTIADAIMDRIIHQAYRFDLKGKSLRKNR